MFGIDDAIIGAVAGPLIGGLLGGKESSQSQSTSQTLDPRMEGAVYGAGGVIPAAQSWYKQNQSGLNSQMLTGMDNAWAQLGSSKQGFDQMQNAGMGLMGGGVAGNPFASGYQGGTNFSGSMNGQGGSLAARPANYQPAQFGQAGPFTNQYAIDSVARMKQAEDDRIAAAKAAEEKRLAGLLSNSFGFGNYGGGGDGYGGYGGGDQSSGDGGGNPGGSGTDSNGSGYA